jgi:hypothetical protein
MAVPVVAVDVLPIVHTAVGHAFALLVDIGVVMSRRRWRMATVGGVVLLATALRRENAECANQKK